MTDKRVEKPDAKKPSNVTCKSCANAADPNEKWGRCVACVSKLEGDLADAKEQIKNLRDRISANEVNEIDKLKKTLGRAKEEYSFLFCLLCSDDFRGYRNCAKEGRCVHLERRWLEDVLEEGVDGVGEKEGDVKTDRTTNEYLAACYKELLKFIWHPYCDRVGLEKLDHVPIGEMEKVFKRAMCATCGEDTPKCRCNVDDDADDTIAPGTKGEVPEATTEHLGGCERCTNCPVNAKNGDECPAGVIMGLGSSVGAIGGFANVKNCNRFEERSCQNCGDHREGEEPVRCWNRRACKLSPDATGHDGKNTGDDVYWSPRTKDETPFTTEGAEEDKTSSTTD